MKLLRALLTTVFLSATVLPAQAQEDPFVDLEFSSALARAEKESKNVLLFCHADTEAASKRMLSKCFSDSQLQGWMRREVVAIIVTAENQGLCNRFQVTHFPCTLIVGPDGTLQHKALGERDAATLQLELQAALMSAGDVSRPEGDDAENPMAWLAWGVYLFSNEADRTEECCQALCTALDNGDEWSPGFRARYFEFILERLSYLKQRESLAVDALFVRRLDLRSRIVAGIGTSREAYEYCRYNYWLRDQDETVTLFQELAKHETEEHYNCKLAILDVELKRCVDWRTYDEVLDVIPDPKAYLETKWAEFKKRTEEDGKSVVDRAKMVDDSAALFECLLQAGKGKDAMEVLELTASKVNTGRTFYAFIERSNRLRLYPMSHRIADRGLELVTSDKGKKMIAKAKAKIPSEEAGASEGGTAPKKGDRGDG